MRDVLKTAAIPTEDGKFLLGKRAESTGGLRPFAQDPPAGRPRTRGENRKWRAIAGLVVAALVVFGGGFLTGAVSVDPTTSGQYLNMRDSRDRQLDLNDVLREDKATATAELEELKDGLESREAAIAGAQKAVEERETAVGKAEEAVEKREEAVTGAEKEKEANTVRNGTWTVGVDIAAGTYRADEPVGATCYWGIYRSGTNGSDIIENDIPGGGRPTVTLSKRQDFNSSRCGTWTKQ